MSAPPRDPRRRGRAARGGARPRRLVGAGGLSPDRRQTFALRLDRYWPDLESRSPRSTPIRRSPARC